MHNKKPVVYVVGDSISLQYGPYLKQMLEPEYVYSRKSGEEEALRNLDVPMGANGGDSAMVRDFLESLAASGNFHADYLLINCGLHDIKTDPATGARQVGEESYRANLELIVNIARGLSSHLVWIETTPVDDALHAKRGCGFERFESDRQRYGIIAEEVMAKAGLPVVHLGRFTEKLGTGKDIFSDGVHFTPHVQQQQAAYIAGYLQHYAI